MEMKLDQIELHNFRCFESLKVSFHPKVTVILADNGGGKTTLLDSIRIAFGSYLSRFPKITSINPSKERDLRFTTNGKQPPYLRIKASLTNEISWDRTERRDKTEKTTSQIPAAHGTKELNSFADTFVDQFNDATPFNLPVIIYYGTERAVSEEMPQRRRNWQKEFRPFDALDGALHGTANFRRFLEWFNEMEEQERRVRDEKRSYEYSLPALDVVRKAIEKMIPDYSHPRIKTSPFRFVVDRDGQEFRLEQLSDGFRIMLAMVADIAGRLAEANPHLKDPLCGEGIVLIDEVDLHLHPKWQRHIIADLCATFPNVQFIVTTHSPIIALGGSTHGTIIHVDSTHQLTEYRESALATYNVNRVLVSSLFGIPFPQAVQWDEKIERQEMLLRKDNLTEDEQATLSQLNDELMPLTATSSEDSEAREIIRKAAEVLKSLEQNDYD